MILLEIHLFLIESKQKLLKNRHFLLIFDVRRKKTTKFSSWSIAGNLCSYFHFFKFHFMMINWREKRKEFHFLAHYLFKMRQKPNIRMWKVFNYGKKKNATKISTTGLENGMKKEGRQLAHPLKALILLAKVSL